MSKAGLGVAGITNNEDFMFLGHFVFRDKYIIVAVGTLGLACIVPRPIHAHTYTMNKIMVMGGGPELAIRALEKK